MPLKRVQFDTDRSRVLNSFADRFTWIPHWGAEITMAVEGLEGQVEEVDRWAGSLAIISTIADADKYRVEAEEEIDDLELPIIEKRALYPVKFEAIHGNDVVISAMARHLLFSNALPKDKWPVHTMPQFEKKVKPLRRQVRNLSSIKRETLWFKAFESESARRLFWTGQILNAHSNPKTKNAIAAQKQNEEHAVA